MTYEGFSESFLKTIIKGSEGDINVGSNDYYKVIGIESHARALLKKKDKETYNSKTVRSFLVGAWRKSSLKAHPDKGGSNEEMNRVSNAWKVLGNEEYRNEYDKVYLEIINNGASGSFKNEVKAKLQQLSEKTDPTMGDLAGGAGAGSSAGSGAGVDIKRYKHLFPKTDFINRKLGGLSSKKNISKFANYVIFVYGRLRPLEDEVWGKGTISKKRINDYELGVYGNFRQEIWNKENLTDVNNYLDEVENKITKVVTSSGGTMTEEAAQAFNVGKLHALVDWNIVLGDEGTAMTEKYHFVTGYRKTHHSPHSVPGIRNIKQTNPNHPSYENVLSSARVFIKYKKRVSDKIAELLREPGWGTLANWKRGELEKKLRLLGEIEEVEIKEKNAYGVEVVRDRYTKMKFDNYSSAELDNKINEVFQRARNEINASGTSSMPHARNKVKNDAISEIKILLQANNKHFTHSYINSGAWIKELDGKTSSEINIFKKDFLDRIYRTVAGKEILEKLGGRMLSVTILGISGDLKYHLKNYKGKFAIEGEKRRLLDIIDRYVNKDREIREAKDEVKKALKDAGLENEVKINEVVGGNWENIFLGLTEDSEVNDAKRKLIEKIDAFLAQNLVDSESAISEIETFLRKKEINENILGDSWKDSFRGKNKNEIEVEKSRFLQLIEEEIDRKEETGEWTEKNKKDAKRDLDNSTKISAINKIKEKLQEGHEKLILKISDLPLTFFTPYKNLEEKMSSLVGIENITSFENELLVVIDEKKKEKLIGIINDAITEIKKEIGSENYELGKLNNYENIIREMIDPDDIETKKQLIKKLVAEQKRGFEGDLEKTKDDNGISLPKIIGITSLVALPIIVLAFIIFKVHRRRLESRRE